ncbi:hypothetical protein AVEN_96204-1 [Araneus ventricosus]|uniref:Uncharacterized protein n=1 Tax=Araneus ventricosus TaxID=182803 RepID=A0A4Y2I3F5_ARAVE|nr:hypothetical protein AVEN_96204-1 [Araneus ventricosus]
MHRPRQMKFGRWACHQHFKSASDFRPIGGKEDTRNSYFSSPYYEVQNARHIVLVCDNTTAGLEYEMHNETGSDTSKAFLIGKKFNVDISINFDSSGLHDFEEKHYQKNGSMSVGMSIREINQQEFSPLDFLAC